MGKLLLLQHRDLLPTSPTPHDLHCWSPIYHDKHNRASFSMRLILPRSALLFRLGSDEFGAILPDIERQRAYDLAEEVRDAVARHAFRPYGEERDAHGVGIVSATCSIGLSVYPTDVAIHEAMYGGHGVVDQARLLHLSENALHIAKNAGGNVVRAADAIHHE